MAWKNKKKINYSSFSLIKKYKKEKLITDHTLNNINNISLEDLIAIKLELTTRFLCGKYYGLPVWRITKQTVIDGLLKAAISICATKKEGARFLGVDYMDFNKLLKKYNTMAFFENECGGETASTESE